MSDSLQPHGLQHARLPCLPPSPGVCSNSCPLSQWCHPTILSFVTPLSACLQFFPASGSFPMSWFFVTGIGASASVSILPMNIHWEFLQAPSDMFLFICKDFLSFWYNRCSWFSLYFPSLNPEWRDSLILETYVLQFWQVFLELFFDNFFPFFWSYFLKFLFVRYLAFIWSCNFLSQ